MSAQPVDVLAVLDAEIVEAAKLQEFSAAQGIHSQVREHAKHRIQLTEARAAVAELIEADRDFDYAEGTGDYLRMKAARERRAAALARCGAQP